MKLIATAFALILASVSSLMAFEIGAMTPEEREIFRQEVRAYLLDSPEVLVEAINVLEQRQAAEATLGDVALIANNAEALFADGYSYAGGNPDGDVVMVEFIDYRCGFCKRAHPDVMELIKTDGNIKYIVKEFPILGDQSMLASRFAISVLHNTDAATYATVNDTLMTFRGEITPGSLERIANDLDLDTAKIFAYMETDAVSAVIAETRALAQRMQINGTPGFVIGDQMIRGYAPLADMQALVADLRLAAN